MLLAGSAWRKECYRCDGSGNITCTKCSGAGKLTCSSCSGRGRGSDGERCWTCSGAGKVTCGRCSGTGQVRCPDCTGSGYFVGWLAVVIYDGANVSPFELASGVGEGAPETLASSVVKQKGSSLLVADSSTKLSFDVDDFSGPAHPSNSSHRGRIQPIRTTADQINQQSIAFIDEDNSTNFYRENESSLTTHDLDLENQTFKHLSSRTGFTNYDGSPGFRLKGQQHRIDWEAFCMMNVNVAELKKTFGVHLSDTDFTRISVKDYPRGGCCNCGVRLCFGCITC